MCTSGRKSGVVAVPPACCWQHGDLTALNLRPHLMEGNRLTSPNVMMVTDASYGGRAPCTKGGTGLSACLYGHEGSGTKSDLRDFGIGTVFFGWHCETGGSVSSPNKGDGGLLYGVSCPTASNCAAAGFYETVETEIDKTLIESD